MRRFSFPITIASGVFARHEGCECRVPPRAEYSGASTAQRIIPRKREIPRCRFLPSGRASTAIQAERGSRNAASFIFWPRGFTEHPTLSAVPSLHRAASRSQNPRASLIDHKKVSPFYRRPDSLNAHIGRPLQRPAYRRGRPNYPAGRGRAGSRPPHARMSSIATAPISSMPSCLYMRYPPAAASS